MLAQLEQIPGVVEARVDWSGQRFLLQLDRSPRAETVIDAASEVLGPTTQRLASVLEQGQIATYIAGSPWLREGETARLSEHEAQVLAQRVSTEAATRASLDDERATRLCALVDAELKALFKTYEGSGLPDRGAMLKDWSALVDRVATHSAAFLTAAEIEPVVAALQECFAK
ncbi:MAG: hypothetical protein EXS13_01500 [Planctomycetes bacterium]|nr:hypothetical protein [Planctomycetota bacterium]